MTRAIDQTAVTTRDRLLDATAALIAEVGWTAVTLRAVADRAEVNKGVVHYHFGSMDALRRAAALHALRALFGDVLEDLRAAPSTVDALRRLTGALAAVDMDSPPAAVSVEAMLHAARDPLLGLEVRAMLVPFRATLRDRLEQDAAAGRVRAPLDPDGVATALTALLDGLMLHAVVDRDLDIQAATDAIAALLQDGQGGSVEPARRGSWSGAAATPSAKALT